MYRRTSEMIREEEQTRHSVTIRAFLQTHGKATAVDIAEQLYATLHLSVGEVQRYLGDLIDRHHVTLDAHGYHAWSRDGPAKRARSLRQKMEERRDEKWENERS